MTDTVEGAQETDPNPPDPSDPEDSVRYMVLLKMPQDIGAPPPALSEAMGAALSEAFAAGSVIDAGGLGPMSDATEISLRGGTVLTTDGPYAEAKEVVGSYAILEARSHEEAVEGARRVIVLHQQHWPRWEGAAEVRRIWVADEAPSS